MKPINLRRDEARALAATGRVLAVRPVTHGIIDKHGVIWVRDGEGLAWLAIPPEVSGVDHLCPFPEPGAKVWGRESWMPWHKCSHEYDEWEPIDREFLTDRGLVDSRGFASLSKARPECLIDSIQYRATSESVGPWRSAATMPRWASRFPSLVVESRRFCRLSRLAGEDAWLAGSEGRPDCPHRWECGNEHAWPGLGAHPDPLSNAAGGRPYRECSCAMEAHREAWDRDNPKHPAAGDPWVWAALLRREDSTP